MRLFSRLAPLALLVALAAGCTHAQLPPTKGSNTLWTVTIPAASGAWGGCGTGQPTCTLVISTLAVPAGTSTCPASTGSNYTPNQTAATGVSINPPTWLQTNTTGTTQCAIAQLVQSANISGLSPVSSPVVSPALPLAPGISGAQENQSALDKPKLPQVQPAGDAPVVAAMQVEIHGIPVSSR